MMPRLRLLFVCVGFPWLVAASEPAPVPAETRPAAAPARPAADGRPAGEKKRNIAAEFGAPLGQLIARPTKLPTFIGGHQSSGRANLPCICVENGH